MSARDVLSDQAQDVVLDAASDAVNCEFPSMSAETGGLAALAAYKAIFETLPKLPAPDCLALARALATAAGHVVEQGWQDIATAPRDGTEVWAWNGEQIRMRWEVGEQWSGWLYTDELLNDADPEPDPPTHWRPLPAPPAEKDPQP